MRYLALAQRPAGSCGANRPTDEYEFCPYCIIGLVKRLQIYINVICLFISWMPTMVIHCSYLQRIFGSLGQTNPKRCFRIWRGKWMEESCWRISGKASRRRQYLGWVVKKKEEVDDRENCGWVGRGWEKGHCKLRRWRKQRQTVEKQQLCRVLGWPIPKSSECFTDCFPCFSSLSQDRKICPGNVGLSQVAEWFGDIAGSGS